MPETFLSQKLLKYNSWTMSKRHFPPVPPKMCGGTIQNMARFHPAMAKVSVAGAEGKNCCVGVSLAESYYFNDAR